MSKIPKRGSYHFRDYLLDMAEFSADPETDIFEKEHSQE